MLAYCIANPWLKLGSAVVFRCYSRPPEGNDTFFFFFAKAVPIPAIFPCDFADCSHASCCRWYSRARACLACARVCQCAFFCSARLARPYLPPPPCPYLPCSCEPRVSVCWLDRCALGSHPEAPSYEPFHPPPRGHHWCVNTWHSFQQPDASRSRVPCALRITPYWFSSKA